MARTAEDMTPTSRTLRWIALTALTLLVIWIAGGFLLVMFAGVLVAIMLRDLGNRLARVTGLSKSTAVMAVTLTLIVLAGLICWFLAPRLAYQVDQLWQAIPQSMSQLRARLAGYSWSETLFRQINPEQLMSNSASILGRLTGAASTVLSFLGTLIVVCFAFLSAIPALLLGIVQGPVMALYVGLLYITVQFVEGYLITPLVQQETVSLPPALTIGSLVLFGTLFGPMGIMLGTPLAAVGIVLVRMAYVEDVLERDNGRIS